MEILVRRPYDESERSSLAYYVVRARLESGDWLVLTDEGEIVILDVKEHGDEWLECEWERIT